MPDIELENKVQDETFQNPTGYMSSPSSLSDVARMLSMLQPCCLSLPIAAEVI